MGTLKNLSFVLVLATLAIGCGEKKIATTPTRPTETAEKVAEKKTTSEPSVGKQIDALSKAPEGGETEKQKKIRLLARQLLVEKLAKQAEAEVAANDTAAMKEARKKVNKGEKKIVDRVEDQANAKIRSGLTCQTQEAWDKVWVDPGAVERTLGFVHSRMTVFNTTPVFVEVIQVEGGGGPVVKDMCPGGSLALIQRIGFSGRNQVAYSASPSPGQKEVGVKLSPRISLRPCSGTFCREEYAATWQIARW